MTGDFFWQEAADRQLRFVAGEIEHYPAGYSFSLTALADALYPHRELVCAASGEVPEELDTFLRTHPAENLSILVKTAENADALAACSPPLPGVSPSPSGAAWYWCENGACQAPVSDFSKLPLEEGV